MHMTSENVQSFLFLQIGGKKPLNCLAFPLQLVCKLFGFHFGNFFYCDAENDQVTEMMDIVEPENLSRQNKQALLRNKNSFLEGH